MANVTSGNPFVCDSTGELTAAKITIQGIVWTGTEASNRDIAANDDFAIADANTDSIIIEKRAAAAGDDLAVWFPMGLGVSGLNITKLDGGICYVYKK